ncbi:hypothetical protein Tco_0730716 [Tanacetum coccineum]
MIAGLKLSAGRTAAVQASTRTKARLLASSHRQEERIDYDEFLQPVSMEALRSPQAFINLLKPVWLHQASSAWKSTTGGSNFLEGGLATQKTLSDGTQTLNATIASIELYNHEIFRRQLQLADASGITCLANEEIFDRITKYLTENKNLFVPVLLTKKIFGNMKRSFQGIHRPLLPAMLTIDAGQSQPSDAPTPSQPVPTPTPSHVQIPPPPITQPPPTPIQHVQSTSPPPQPSSEQLTSSPPPIQPVQPTPPITFSSTPITTIPDTQPTLPPSPQIPSPSYHDTEGPSFEPSYHMSPPPSHEPEIQTSRTSEESEQLRNLLDLRRSRKLENKLRQKRKSEETEDKEDAEGQDQEVPSQTDQGNEFATPEKSKDSGEAQADQISPSTLEAAQILTNVASEGFKGSQAPLGSKIYRRKPKSTPTPTKILDFEEPAESQVNTERVQRRKGKDPMTEEDLQAEVQASKKSKELQELADLEAAQRLQATMNAETQRQIDLDALPWHKDWKCQEDEAQKKHLQLNLTTFKQDLMQIRFLQKRFNKKKGSNILLRIGQILYERYKKQDQTFVAIGSEEDERAIKKMNEQAADKEKEQKAESVHEEVKEGERTKKGTPDEDKVVDVEILDHQYPIAVYELVMEKYQDEIPEGFDKMLWGDLIIMFNQERFNTTAGNPVKEILLKLNLPDHRSILTDSKIHIKMVMEVPSSS